jgi:hypothetical protein
VRSLDPGSVASTLVPRLVPNRRPNLPPPALSKLVRNRSITRTFSVSMTAESAPTWGDFQALTSLSVALNAAYATLYSFVEDSLKHQKTPAMVQRDHLREGKNVREPSPSYRNDIRTARLILSDVNNIELSIKDFNTFFLKPTAIMCFLIGIGQLIYSSYNFHDTITGFWSTIAWLTLMPFMLTVIIYSILSVIVFLDAIRIRKSG